VPVSVCNKRGLRCGIFDGKILSLSSMGVGLFVKPFSLTYNEDNKTAHQGRAKSTVSTTYMYCFIYEHGRDRKVTCVVIV
jgi:hypothetical protein